MQQISRLKIEKGRPRNTSGLSRGETRGPCARARTLRKIRIVNRGDNGTRPIRVSLSLQRSSRLMNGCQSGASRRKIGWTCARCTRIESVSVFPRMRMLAMKRNLCNRRTIMRKERSSRRKRAGLCTDFDLAGFRQALAPAVSPRVRTRRVYRSDVDVPPAIYRRLWRVISHRGTSVLKFSFGLELEVSSRAERSPMRLWKWTFEKESRQEVRSISKRAPRADA